jgi:flagellar motility protein MotE (MotC chaperone)
MSLNVNINPLNFREMRLREPQGARLVGEGINSYKRGEARRRAERIEDEDRARAEEERQRKQALDNELADMLDVDKAIEDIDAEIKKLEAENKAIESQVAPKPVSSEYDFTDFSVV